MIALMTLLTAESIPSAIPLPCSDSRYSISITVYRNSVLTYLLGLVPARRGENTRYQLPPHRAIHRERRSVRRTPSQLDDVLFHFIPPTQPRPARVTPPSHGARVEKEQLLGGGGVGWPEQVAIPGEASVAKMFVKWNTSVGESLTMMIFHLYAKQVA